MAEDEKREELKRQLAAGEYQTLIDVILDRTGRLIQKLTRNPKLPSFWYSAAVIILLTSLISFLISILLGEFSPLRRAHIPREIALMGLSFAGIIAIKVYVGMLFTTLRSKLLDAIGFAKDLNDLQHWLIGLCEVRRHLFFSLAFAFLTFFYAVIFIAPLMGGISGFGASFSVVVNGFIGGIMIYYLFLALSLPVRLSRYQFKLYGADPSSSEVVDSLADMLNNFVFITAVLAALATLIFAFLGVLNLASLVFIVFAIWIPLTTLFIINQYALSKIITTAKWKTLNDIQAKIEKLQTQEELPGKETLEHLNKLMDYHNRIKATRNSALDLRAGLNFLNSLLLPLIAFVLGNLDKILAYFS
ncbi:MAG: hypothetical protein DPW09_03870 [Anaerolineae bacterium]|nr:hypothetical protein [Anaerolineales bacterium]MCQ3972569.1 hypothetical protein [Anaerolineae bacterium]